MAKYYIDPDYGLESNDGLSPEKPKKSNIHIDVKCGDNILFKRGSLIRDRLHNIGGIDGIPITYGAYGEGEKPVFMTSVDVSNVENWVEDTTNIWLLNVSQKEVCNIVFDNGESCGNMCWEFDEMSKQGDWHESDDTVRLYSTENPGTFYTHIEIVNKTGTIIVDVVSNIDICGLSFANANFVLAAPKRLAARNINITDCEFRFIGGGVWSREQKIRFGNAIEFWDYAENINIAHCLFDNIYDSCLTHQGGNKCQAAYKIRFIDNLFMNYGMAAYECRDVMPIDGFFNRNICINAGGGFSMQTETPPRQSEIYPEPMGHHIFIWRISMATPNGCLEIKENIFFNAPIGAAIYSITSEEAENQMDIDNNIYYTENDDLLNRFGGNCYGVAEFEKYKSETGKDLNSKYKKVDIDVIVSEWRRRECSSK